MVWDKWLRLAGVLATLISCSSAWSERVTYDLILTIDSVESTSDCTKLPPMDYFGCLEAGMSFRGSFAVDAPILATDGINTTAAIYDFYLPFGALIYSTGPENTSLRGFRNPMTGAAAPGFVIEDGEVVDLLGGVYGSSDFPFIDMYGPGHVARNHFSASDGGSRAVGTLTVASPVPEPEIAAAYAMGLGMLCVAARRRRRQVTAKPAN